MPDHASPTRVLLFDMPRLMSDLVHAAVEDQPDLELVGEAVSSEQLAHALVRTGPDLLILPAGHAELPAAAADAFDSRPRLKILVLTGSGERAFLWELTPWRVSLGDMSQARLRAAMREPRQWTWHA